MIVDCDSCEVRGNACGDCVIGVLLGLPGVPREGRDGSEPGVDGPSGASTVQLDAPERRALDVLADQGLVPRLRLVAAAPRRATRPGDAARQSRDAG